MAEQDPAGYDRWARPAALGRRGYALVTLVPVLLAAAAFGVLALVAGDEEAASGTTVRLPVSAWAPGGGGADALIQGVLRLDEDRCVYLEAGQDGADPGKVWPVWPAGYEATEEAGRLTLRDDDGQAVARDGDLVRMGGGYASAEAYPVEPCLPDSGEVAVVESSVTVLDPQPLPAGE